MTVNGEEKSITLYFFLFFLHPSTHIYTLFIVMLPLELQPLRFRLATVAPPCLLLFLVTAKARAKLDIDAWRSRETKALGNFD